jgi:hypothetical protein
MSAGELSSLVGSVARLQLPLSPMLEDGITHRLDKVGSLLLTDGTTAHHSTAQHTTARSSLAILSEVPRGIKRAHSMILVLLLLLLLLLVVVLSCAGAEQCLCL